MRGRIIRYDYEITIDDVSNGENFIGAVGAVRRAREIALATPESTIQMIEIVTVGEEEPTRELLFSATGGGAAGGGHEAIVGEM